jgi:mannose-1-phosphate guanylyltransferase
MAGGSGERFWPMSRQSTPKHLLRLLDDCTLLETTVRRLEGLVSLQNSRSVAYSLNLHMGAI